jgi:hypothetical protein
MFNIKILLIAIASAALLSGVVVGIAVWKNRTNHYTAIIEKEHADINSKLSAAKSELIVAERKYNNVSTQLEQSYLELKKEQDAYKTSLAKYRTERGGLLFKSGSCIQGHTNPPDSAPSNSVAGATESATSCELSRESSEAIAATYADADEMRARLLVAKKYAEEIEKQREDLAKQAK